MEVDEEFEQWIEGFLTENVIHYPNPNQQENVADENDDEEEDSQATEIYEWLNEVGEEPVEDMNL